MANSILGPHPQALAEPIIHHDPVGFSDRFALGFTKLFRVAADTFFAKRYGRRAIVLETVAAAPGMVGATVNHLTALRRMCDDEGWICTLMEMAVISYTLYLKEIDEGRSPDLPAPAIARHFRNLPDTATLRDVVLLVRADEAHHRDVNHEFASTLARLPMDRVPSPYPLHAYDIRAAA